MVTAARVVPYVGTWIEIRALTHFSIFRNRRSLRGNVDRNIAHLIRYRNAKRRSLRGNVDRNKTRVEIEYIVDQSFPTWERG